MAKVKLPRKGELNLGLQVENTPLRKQGDGFWQNRVPSVPRARAHHRVVKGHTRLTPHLSMFHWLRRTSVHFRFDDGWAEYC